jgi:hypothetical protein
MNAISLGHPRLIVVAIKMRMPGTRPGMTILTVNAFADRRYAWLSTRLHTFFLVM